MSWLFSQALVAEYSAASSLDGEQCAELRSMPFVQDDLCSDKMKGIYHLSPFGMMYVPSTEQFGADVLTWFLEGFPAQTLARPGKKQELMELQAASGWKWQGSFSRYDLDSCSWKTRQCSLIEDSTEFLGIWPRRGSMRNGECLDRTTSAPITVANGAGLWPTPCHGSPKWGGTFQEVGGSQNKLRGTPTGKLYVNPDFWESLMGWPIGWTGIGRLETDKTLEWLQQHSVCSQKEPELSEA